VPEGSTTGDVADLVGQSFTAPEPYEVTRGKIREFAEAVGESSPLCFDVEAAQAAGYADLVAPPTFAVIPSFTGLHEVMARIGAPLQQQVHGEQGFVHHRPIVAGDVLVATATAQRIRAVAGNLFVTVSCDVADTSGAPVTTARSVVVVRGGAR
jgi:acyl dehydratase